MDKIKYTEKPKEGDPWDVAIIGSGPSALTAAIYTTRGAASTILFAGESWGGQLMLTTDVDNFPGFPKGIQGPELMIRMRNQAERFSTEIIEKTVTQITDAPDGSYKLVTANEEYLAKTIIIATGADTKWLGVPGEDKLRGRGVSSCAPCDAPFFKDKKVAVVGGGDSAMEEALVLSKYASQVIMIHRRDQFRASEAMRKRVLQEEKITHTLWDTVVEEIIGDQKLEKMKLRTKWEGINTQAMKDIDISDLNGQIVDESKDLVWEIPVDGIFVAIGHTPSTEALKDFVELDEKGYIKRFEKDGYKTLTSKPGIFVAGDVHDQHYRQAITAAGFGCMAGMDTLKYLDKNIPIW